MHTERRVVKKKKKYAIKFMEPNAALQETPTELSMPIVLSIVWQSCGGEIYNWEHSRYSQAPWLVQGCTNSTYNSQICHQQNEESGFSSVLKNIVLCSISPAWYWSCNIQFNIHLLEQHGQKQYYLTQAPTYKHVHTDTKQRDYKVLP